MADFARKDKNLLNSSLPELFAKNSDIDSGPDVDKFFTLLFKAGMLVAVSNLSACLKLENFVNSALNRNLFVMTSASF